MNISANKKGKANFTSKSKIPGYDAPQMWSGMPLRHIPGVFLYLLGCSSGPSPSLLSAP